MLYCVIKRSSSTYHNVKANQGLVYSRIRPQLAIYGRTQYTGIYQTYCIQHSFTLCMLFFKVYHNVISKYLLKIYHFEYDRMETGTMLAALDNNMNVGRDQKTTINVTKKSIKLKKHFKITYRKPSRKFIARKFYDKKQYDYLKTMMEEVRKITAQGTKNILMPKRKIMAPVERDSRRNLIEKCVKYSRFT